MMDTIIYSDEQKAIVSLARPPPSREGDEGQGVDIVRITSAAGSGKTTTLLGFSNELIRLNHERIMYVTFSKAAVADAQEKFDQRVQCRTIHSATYAELEFAMKIVDEAKLDSYILERFRPNIETFLSGIRLTGEMKRRQDPLLGYKKSVAFYIRKTLTRFLQSADSLEDGFDPNRRYPSCTYYPAIMWHRKGTVPGLPKEYGDFYVRHAKILFESIRNGSINLMPFDMIVKEAQLRNVRFPCDALLVDESQDCTECQIQLMVDQKKYGIQVVLVGDAAQTIYGFRGAKSKWLMNISGCDDRKLTRSYRFGPEIAAVANTILFLKEFSPQTTTEKNSWNPYRVEGVSGVSGKICGPEDTFADKEQYTVIARTNLTLFRFCLENLVGQESEIRVAINGNGESSGRGKWISTFKEIGELFSLYQGSSTALNDWSDFQGENVTSWDMFKRIVQRRELNKFAGHIGLIEKYGGETLEVIQKFRDNVIDKNYPPDKAHVILTTVHAAKGMEWNHVKILDDLGTLARYKTNDRFKYKGEFAAQSWGDDINLWYVAVTRARLSLSLPQRLVELITSLDIIINYGPIIADLHSSTQDAVLNRISFCYKKNFKSTGDDRAPTVQEFKLLYNTLAIRYKVEMDSLSSDFNMFQLSTDTNWPIESSSTEVSSTEAYINKGGTKRMKLNHISCP